MLPDCTACQRTKRVCVYRTPARLSRNSAIGRLQARLAKLEQPTLLPDHDSEMSVANYSGLSETQDPCWPFLLPHVDPFQHVYVRTTSLDLSICTGVFDVVGKLVEIHMVIHGYFNKVHLWFPFIAKESFFRGLRTLNEHPSAEKALLLLCMYLVTSEHEYGQRDFRNSAYVKAKSYLAMIAAAGRECVMTIQASALVSLYEMGHGMHQAAYITLGACARAAMVLGLDTRSSYVNVNSVGDNWTIIEEQSRVWWAIIILDR